MHHSFYRQFCLKPLPANYAQKIQSASRKGSLKQCFQKCTSAIRSLPPDTPQKAGDIQKNKMCHSPAGVCRSIACSCFSAKRNQKNADHAQHYADEFVASDVLF